MEEMVRDERRCDWFGNLNYIKKWRNVFLEQMKLDCGVYWIKREKNNSSQFRHKNNKHYMKHESIEVNRERNFEQFNKINLFVSFYLIAHWLWYRLVCFFSIKVCWIPNSTTSVGFGFQNFKLDNVIVVGESVENIAHYKIQRPNR